jgi:hypothetical protein
LNSAVVRDMSVCRRRHFRRTSDMRQELFYMYGVTPPINNMHYRSTLHTHLAAVLQTGRPSSTAWESRDTQMSPDLTSCSSLGYTKECAAVGTLAGVEFRRLVTLSSASGLCAALSRTRQSQNRNRSELKDCLHSLIRRSPQTIEGKENRRRIRQSGPREPTSPWRLSWIRHAEKSPSCHHSHLSTLRLH